MLCLKAEVLDDHDLNSSSISTNSNNGGGGGFGFILPMNLGSSIHKYLWRNGRFSNRSVSSGDGYPPSISDFEDIKTPEKRSGQLKFGNMSLYKCQLEEDVKKLQEQLQEEIELRLALASAVEHSDSSISSSPCQLPDKAQELLDSIAILEITVSKLEQEAIALQYQLSQEKNERHLAEWRLRRLACRTSPPLDSSHTCLTELIRRPSCGDNVEGKVEDKPPWDDANKLNRVHFVEKLWHYPNRLSEEMVWCMRDIFVFLADSSKPSSSECMASPSSPQGHLSYSSLASFSESPTMNSYRKSPSVDMEQVSEVSPRYCKIDPYIIPGKVDWIQGIGAYSTAVEVSWLSVGKKELEYASGALKRFRFCT